MFEFLSPDKRAAKKSAKVLLNPGAVNFPHLAENTPQNTHLGKRLERALVGQIESALIRGQYADLNGVSSYIKKVGMVDRIALTPQALDYLKEFGFTGRRTQFNSVNFFLTSSARFRQLFPDWKYYSLQNPTRETDWVINFASINSFPNMNSKEVRPEAKDPANTVFDTGLFAHLPRRRFRRN